MKVPFFDLKRQMAELGDELKETLARVIDNAAFASGPFVADFEEKFAQMIGSRYCVALNSGTSALHCALAAIGIGQGDEVITTPFTFIATVEAISYAGTEPIFVDIDKDYYTIAPESIKDFIMRRTAYDRDNKTLTNRQTRRRIKAIIPVHLYGQSADMTAILDIAREYNLKVIEDCAQSHLATDRGKNTGTIGDIGCFSFYPSKNLGACGEGGALITNDPEVALKVRMFRDHGQKKKYYHELIGHNFRMDGFQGAALNVKIKYLKQWNEQRQKIAQRYHELLSDLDWLRCPKSRDGASHVYHLYVVRVKNRVEVIKYLEEHGVGTGIHYPFPIHLTEAYQHLGYKEGDFPVSEACAREVLSLPMFPELMLKEVEYVTKVLRKWEDKEKAAEEQGS